MHWVIQENFANEPKYVELIEFLERMGIPHHIVKVVPFVGEIIPDVDIWPSNNAIVIGSYSMRKVAAAKHWRPGSFDIEKFGYDYFIEILGNKMLNHDALVCRFSDLPNDFNGLRFVRPVADSKAFAGGVYSAEDFREFQKSVASVYEQYEDSINNNTLCMMTSPKKIYSEYRFWVVDGQVVTASRYKLGSMVSYKMCDRNEHPELYEYAREVDLTFIDGDLETYVIDLCVTDDGIKIVEFNTLNAAGFYDCDIQKLAAALDSVYTSKSPGVSIWERD